MSTSAIARLRERVVADMSGDASGHDHHHALRVVRTAVRLAELEGADVHVTELAALLHDTDDYKLVGGDGTPRRARAWMLEAGVEPGIVEQVCTIIERLSFRGAALAEQELSLEGHCVRDADRLDAMGALGIARTFAYGGTVGRPLHDPDTPVVHHATQDGYRNHVGTTINHFHEKLLLLNERLHTEAARKLGVVRHQRMVRFLADFAEEWDGADLP